MALEKIPSDERSPSGMSLPTLMVICLLCAVASLGALWYFGFSGKARTERAKQKEEAREAQSELNIKRASSDAQLALAQSGQAEALVLVREATNALTQLLQSSASLQERMAAFSTNSMGQEAALYPDLVTQARRLYQNDAAELPASIAAIERLESARRIEQHLIEAGGTAYLPDENLKKSVQDASAWARSNLEKVNAVSTTLSAISRETKIKVFTGTRPDSPLNLASAIQKMDESETVTRQTVIIEKTSQAKSEAADVVAKAEAERIIAEAKAKAVEIVRASQETAAAQERATQIKEAEDKIKDTETDAKKKKILDEITHQKLLVKAAEPAIKSKLAPFIALGYWQGTKIDTDRKPVSYSALQEMGALNPTDVGKNLLVRVGTTKSDKVRPRWAVEPNNTWKRRPAQIEEVNEVQALLIELGPVLVETGMLSP